MPFQTTDPVALARELQALLDGDEAEKVWDEIENETPALKHSSVLPFDRTRDRFINTMIPEGSCLSPGLNAVDAGCFWVTQRPPEDRGDPINVLPVQGMMQKVDCVVSLHPVNLAENFGGKVGSLLQKKGYTEQKFDFVGHEYVQISVECADHSTPGDANILVDVSERVEGKKTVVHCNAGVGRSWMLPLFAKMMEKILAGELLDLKAIMLTLRTLRPGAIQTFEQFRYAIEMVIVKLGRTPPQEEESSGGTKRPGDKKEKDTEKRAKPDVAKHDSVSKP